MSMFHYFIHEELVIAVCHFASQFCNSKIIFLSSFLKICPSINITQRLNRWDFPKLIHVFSFVSCQMSRRLQMTQFLDIGLSLSAKPCSSIFLHLFDFSFVYILSLFRVKIFSWTGIIFSFHFSIVLGYLVVWIRDRNHLFFLYNWFFSF